MPSIVFRPSNRGQHFSFADSYWSFVAYPNLTPRIFFWAQTKSLCAESIIASETHWRKILAAKRFLVPASLSQAFFPWDDAKKNPINFKAKTHEMITNICKIVYFGVRKFFQ
jgi:hypothetical protein